MKLYIIRHGETAWNVEGRLQGQSDTELNENGVRLAKVTAEGLKNIPFDLGISSPLRRAKHTAELVLAGRNVPLTTDDRLMELSFGSWEAFYHELTAKPELQDKTILIATHGCCMRALLRNVYEDKNDFWHGGVPYNCAVSIIEVQNGVSTLLADNKIYYDPSDCVNFYKEVK